MKYIRGGYFLTKLQKRQSPAIWRGFARFDETGAILSKQARVGKSQLRFNRGDPLQNLLTRLHLRAIALGLCRYGRADNRKEILTSDQFTIFKPF